MRVVAAKTLRAASFVPRVAPRSRAAPAPALARRAAAIAAAPRFASTHSLRARAPLLTPALRRGFSQVTQARMAPLGRPASLRPSGVAIATVAGLGVIAAGASARVACAARRVARGVRADASRWWLPRSPAASFATATLVGSLVLAALAVLDARLAVAAPEVIAGPGPRTRGRLDAAPSLTAPYRPFPGLRHRHAVRRALIACYVLHPRVSHA